jgi:tetratricopeptide (TPR) repeat protein
MVGDVFKAQGKLDDALASYRDSLALRKRLAEADPSNTLWQNDLDSITDQMGALSYLFVLAGKFADALEASDEAISVAPQKIWIHTNRAHALMFLGRLEEARALYLKYGGTNNVQEEKSWETIILDDFTAIREADLTHPLMDEIAELFGKNVAEPATPQPEQAAR